VQGAAGTAGDSAAAMTPSAHAQEIAGTSPDGQSPIGTIRFEESLLERAKRNDPNAISTMFRQFVPSAETVSAVEYLGLQGIWGWGTHCFACLTSRRIASIRVSFLGEIFYQDGYLEYVNSNVILQPSKLWLYVFLFLAVVFDLYILTLLFMIHVLLALVVGLPVAFLLLVFSARIYYGYFKCGLIVWIREGIGVYVFANRGRVIAVNRFFRKLSDLQEIRRRETGQLA
jgi:hypothetical protein